MEFVLLGRRITSNPLSISSPNTEFELATS